MRKLNKQQQTILLIAGVIALVIGLIASWIYYEYESARTPGTSLSQESSRNNNKIPSVSGQGSVPGDDYVYDKNGNKTAKDKDSKSTNSDSKRTSSDAVYNAPNGGQGSGEFKHNIDASCFTPEQDHIGEQLIAQQKKEIANLKKDTENKITKLISDIEKAKPTILAHDKGYEDTGYKPNRNARKPTKPYLSTEVRNYATAWSDRPFHGETGYSGHDFATRANNIYTSETTKQTAIVQKYSSKSCK